MKLPPEKVMLLHDVDVVFRRDGYARSHAGHMVGTMAVLCKPIHLAKILGTYPITQYRISCVQDPLTGQQFPELTHDKKIFKIGGMNNG